MSTVTKDNPNPFDQGYANAAGALPGAAEPWIDGLRQTARAHLGTEGIPTPKVEAWKYTPLNVVRNTDFIPADKADDIDVTSIPVTAPRLESAFQLVLVNGQYRPDLSDDLAVLPEGVSVELLNEMFSRDTAALKDDLGGLAAPADSFAAALNTAYMEHGLVLRFGRSEGELPRIHIVSIGASGSQSVAFHPRLLVSAEANARGLIVESHIGLPGQMYLSNPLNEIYIHEGANLQHYTLVHDDIDAAHIGRTAVQCERDSTYASFILSLGGHLVRRDVHADLTEEGAHVRVDGAYALSGAQHSDITSEIRHLVPHTSSNQVVKGVLAGESRGVFQGRIHVARDAQGTDGRQLHKALLLNRGPEVDSKPELEIYADDVQCAHGAAIGEMDHDHLFYLMSRGIDEATARAMLVEGFLDDVIFEIGDEDVQALIHDLVKGWLVRQHELSTAGSP